MPIPVCREKKYTNDGCCIYECLNCKFDWELRGSLLHREAGYWIYCPCCGCKWKLIIDGKNRWVRFYEQYSKYPSGEPGTKQAWLLEERTVNRDGEIILDWKRCDFLDVHMPCTAKHMLEQFQAGLKERSKDQIRSKTIKVEFRFRLVRVIHHYVEQMTNHFVYSKNILWL